MLIQSSWLTRILWIHRHVGCEFCQSGWLCSHEGNLVEDQALGRDRVELPAIVPTWASGWYSMWHLWALVWLCCLIFFFLTLMLHDRKFDTDIKQQVERIWFDIYYILNSRWRTAGSLIAYYWPMRRSGMKNNKIIKKKYFEFPENFRKMSLSEFIILLKQITKKISISNDSIYTDYTFLQQKKNMV